MPKIKLPESLSGFDLPPTIPTPPPLPPGNIYHLGSFGSLDEMLEHLFGQLPESVRHRTFRPLSALELFVLRNRPQFIAAYYGYIYRASNRTAFERVHDTELPDSYPKHGAYLVSISDAMIDPLGILDHLVLNAVRSMYATPTLPIP
jgi:hypothetical protein